MPASDASCSMKSLLLKVRQRIQSLETSRHLEYWLQDVVLAEGAQGDLTLQCPNAFSLQWLSGRHGEALSNLFSEEAGRDLRLTFQIDPPSDASRSIDERDEPTSSCPNPNPKPETRTQERPSPKEPFLGWNPRFRFSTFVDGRSNGFACSAAKEVARQAQSQYNPLLIHAPTGLGKSHLGQAIGYRLFAGNREPADLVEDG